MKLLSILIWISLAAFSSAQCPSGYGRTGSPFPLIVHLEPGQTQSLTWDWTGCDYGVHNWLVYVTKPGGPGGFKELPRNSLLSVSAIDSISGSGPDFEEPYRKFFLSADCKTIVLTLSLGSRARKALDVQVQQSGSFGETKSCP